MQTITPQQKQQLSSSWMTVCNPLMNFGFLLKNLVVANPLREIQMFSKSAISTNKENSSYFEMEDRAIRDDCCYNLSLKRIEEKEQQIRDGTYDLEIHGLDDMYEAMDDGNPTMVRWYMEKGVDIQTYGIFEEAVDAAYPMIIRMFIERRGQKQKDLQYVREKCQWAKEAFDYDEYTEQFWKKYY